MSAMADYLEAQLLNHLFRGATFSKPANIYVALLSTPAVDSMTGSTVDEVTGGGYARMPISQDNDQWSVPGAAGSIVNVSGMEWIATGAAFGFISGLAYCDALTGGNVLLHGSLTVPREVLENETFTLPSGNLTVTMA